MQIINCSIQDLDSILELHEAARKLQVSKNMVVWPVFEKSFIEKEIVEQRQWKLVINNSIACNWAITFEDKDIWGERDDNNSIYIHRIATAPAFRGNRFIDNIVTWARSYALLMKRQYIRLDTLGNNTKLIEHYTSAGFNFLGIHTLKSTKNLPEHYHRENNCCFFEMTVI